MLYFIILFLSSIIDVSSLGNPDFAVRENAEGRLKAAGVFALPALLAGRRSEDPEIRFRINQIIPKWQEFTLNQKARNLLYSPFPIDYIWLWNQRGLRDRMMKIAIAEGAFATSEDWLPVNGDVTDTQWYWSIVELRQNFEEARNYLGITRAGWPF